MVLDLLISASSSGIEGNSLTSSSSLPSPPHPSHSPSLSHTFPSHQIGLTSPYLPSSPFCVKVMEIVLVAKMFEVESSGAWALEGQLLAATVDPWELEALEARAWNL